ncbi:MAG TPA: M56 family metallopeptidase [Acidobacteriaceae bacterium]|nr:M56 family metallopeptidase [Acidobacteriaceae bacterium]
MNISPGFLAQPLIAHLGWTLLHFLWQGTLIAALYAAVRGLASQWMSARARYILACLSLASMASAPILTYGFLASDSWRWSVPAASIPQSQVASSGNIVSLAPWYSLGLDSLQRVLPWLVMAWFLGVVVLLIRLVRGTLFAVHLRSRGTRSAPYSWRVAIQRIAAQLSVAPSVRLMISSVVDVPVVIGWLRPLVLMPAAAMTGTAPEHIEALLAHELAHIRRHDYLVNVLQRAVEAVLFYHPAVWWVSGQIRKERELCCDDLAVAASGDALAYAHALADLELSRPAHAHIAVAANGGSLLTRIRRLVGQSQPAPHTAIGPVAALALTFFVLSVGGAAFVRAAQTSAGPVGVVERNSIWVDTVRRGDMLLTVRGRGVLATNTTADLRLPLSMLKEVIPGQTVSIMFTNRTEMVAGKVAGTSPGAAEGTVAVQITSALPPDVQQGVDLVGTIQEGGLKNVLWVGRPFACQPSSTGYLFKLEQNGEQAVRTKVEFGRASVATVEIRSGLAPGDKVILSNMARFQRYDRIMLK